MSPEVAADSMQTPPSAVTTVHADGICCASEVPVIHSLLDSLPGVVSVDVVMDTKQVIVTHDHALLPPAALVAALNSAYFMAKLCLTVHSAVHAKVNCCVTDTSLSSEVTADGMQTPPTTVTKVHAAGICCPSEVSVIHSVLNHLLGVVTVDVVVVAKQVIVTHDHVLMPPAALVAALNSAHLEATLCYTAHSVGHPKVDCCVEDTIMPPEVAADGMQTLQQTITKVHAAGICCPSEVSVIHSLLDHLPGVVNVNVVVVTKQVIVTHDPALVPPAALVAALNSAHLEASLTGHHLVQVSMSWLPPWRILLCGFFVLISWFGKITSPAWLEYFKYAALGAVLLGAPPVVLRAIGALRARTLDINTLMIIAVAGAVALQDFEEGGSIVFLFALAEWLEDKCVSKARGALASVLTLQPETAVLACTGNSVPAQSIVVDDEVLVRPGDKVPVDGTIIRGSTTMDESMLTGESKSVAKSSGSTVLAGTLNSGSGPVVVKATAPAAASAVAKLASLVQEAVAQKSATERLIQVFARWYTPIVVVAAVLIALIPSLLHRDKWREWTYLALLVLVTACPCALVISTPVATVCAIARAAKHGVLVKGSEHLEALAKVQIITMDKSGTLTAGNFQVVAAHYFSERHHKTDVLGYAAALEQQSSHPLASAVLGYAAANNALAASHIATGVHVIPGLGITGHVSGHKVAVGNALLIQQEKHTATTTGSSSQASKDNHADAAWDSAMLNAHTLAEAAGSEYGASACYVAVDGALVGLLLLCDSVRPYAAEALAQLRHECGVHIAMLTGDNRVAACSVAAQLGLAAADVHAALLPQDKLALLGHYKLQYRHIAHVGDGVNDAPALAAASVGVAMGAGGTALAVEAADIALFTNNLTTLVLALLLSRRMMWIIRVNIVFSVAVKLVVLVLAGYNRVTLWAAVLADVGSAIIVVCLSLTLLRFGASATTSSNVHKHAPCCSVECGLEPAHHHTAGHN